MARTKPKQVKRFGGIKGFDHPTTATSAAASAAPPHDSSDEKQSIQREPAVVVRPLPDQRAFESPPTSPIRPAAAPADVDTESEDDPLPVPPVSLQLNVDWSAFAFLADDQVRLVCVVWQFVMSTTRLTVRA
jgi:hypothetical protein